MVGTTISHYKVLEKLSKRPSTQQFLVDTVKTGHGLI